MKVESGALRTRAGNKQSEQPEESKDKDSEVWLKIEVKTAAGVGAKTRQNLTFKQEVTKTQKHRDMNIKYDDKHGEKRPI